MALTVEDGSGVLDADSYIAASFVATYADAYGEDKTGWLALSSSARDAACRVAAVVLDSRWRFRFPGLRATEDQGLAWPRSDALYIDGYPIDYQSIPVEVQRAQAHLALLSSQGVDIASDTEQTMQIDSATAASGAGVTFSVPISTRQFRDVEMLLDRVLVRRSEKWSWVPV